MGVEQKKCIVILLVAIGARPAMAQDLPAIVVTGQSLPQPPGTGAYGSVIIARDRLTDSATGRLEDVLRDVAGFQQFRRADSRAANPTTQGATLRALGGNASSRALVLLDGVPQADPFAGWIPWPALDPARLSAVRVTRGGGAGAFGAGALAGTIELFSAGPDALPSAGAGLAYGSRDAVETDAGVAARLGQGFATLSGRYDRGDGYVLLPEDQRGPVDVPARYEQWSVAARGVVAVAEDAELQMRGLAFGDDRRRGVRGAESSNDGADASARLVVRGDWAFEALAYVQSRSFTSGFVSVGSGRTTATPTLDQFNTPATGLGGKIELRPLVGTAHSLQLGFDLRQAAGRTRERFRFQNGAFTRLREAGGRTLVAGAYLEDSWLLSDRLTLTGGVRLDRWWVGGGFLTEREIDSGAGVTDQDYVDRSGWAPTARAGAIVALTPALDLRGAGYLGFRLPTLNEFYRPFRVGADATGANAALKPERLRGLEAGLDFAPLSTARAGVTLFWNEVEDAVANVTRGRGPGVFPDVGFVAAGGVFRRRENVDAVRSAGVEATAALDYGRWGFNLSYAFTDAEVEASGGAAEFDGRRPAQTPRHQASGTLRYAVPHGPRSSLTFRYTGAQFEDDLETRRLGDAFTVDAVAGLPLGRGLALELRGENLLNATIESGISEAGIIDRGTPRTLWVGLRWQGR